MESGFNLLRQISLGPATTANTNIMNQTRSLWPLAIILTFVVFISCTVGLVVLACSQKADLVSEDYYEQEIRFQNHLDRLDRTSNVDASIIYEAATQRIRIALPRAQSDHALRGRIELYRPSASGLDRQLALAPDARGIQTIDAAKLRPGLWKVRITWSAENQDYFLERAITVSRS